MKTLKQCQAQVAADHNYSEWCHIPYDRQAFYGEEVARMYAREVAQDALNRAAENAETFLDFEDMLQIAVVDRDSITNTVINTL